VLALTAGKVCADEAGDSNSGKSIVGAELECSQVDKLNFIHQATDNLPYHQRIVRGPQL